MTTRRTTVQTYRMSLSLNVIRHLGLNLYSSVSAVISEVVANSWDADATTVWIDVSEDMDKITIRDDGHGMNVSEANERYLQVGYQRRLKGKAKTQIYKRPVMGRKGIGKLSLFSIANTIDVFSQKKGDSTAHGFRMSLIEITDQIGTDEKAYHPKVLTNPPKLAPNGTLIEITDFRKKKRQTVQSLRVKLARRFSIIGSKHNFKIVINKKEITASDRDYYHKVQFLWTYGKCEDVLSLARNVKEHETRQNLVGKGKYTLSGWIGTVDESTVLKDSVNNENLNRLVVMVRGKVAQEDLLSTFSEGGVYTKYIFGELQADFLDLDTEDDISTSSRQSIVEDDERFIGLREFVQKELKHIQSKWTEYRNDHGVKKAIAIPAIKDWYSTLKGDHREKAKILFGKIGQMTVQSDDDRRTLLKHAILAFENLRVKDMLDNLSQLESEDLSQFLKIFKDVDDIEASYYRQIVATRVGVIDSLAEKVDANSRERVLQEHLFDHLWLLDPSWERVETTRRMEQTVLREFKKVRLTDDEKRGRIDIRYRTTARKHLIIELKRPSVRISTSDVIAQVDKYRSALEKALESVGEKDMAIEVVTVVGIDLTDWTSSKRRLESKNSLQVKQIRVVTYDELIHSAQSQYADYLERSKEVGKINDLIQKIDSVSATKLGTFSDTRKKSNGTLKSRKKGNRK